MYMLSQITIKNFAIIDSLEIVFKDGLTVLTGETGAGKSIIADALDFLLGSRSSSDLIKTGADKALVEGIFHTGAIHAHLPQWFEKNDFELIGNEIIISRELTQNGSKVRINGSLANVSHLSYLREYLLDIHEQSGHIDLLKTEKQIEILDDFGDEIHKKLLLDYKKTYEEYKSLKNKLDFCNENLNTNQKQKDFLEFQIKEIQSAHINDLNEEDELKTKRGVLLNKKELVENTEKIKGLINNDSAVESLHATTLHAILPELKKLIAKCSNHDKSFESYIEIIDNATNEIKELASFVNSYSESIDEGNDNLNEIEERLDLFYKLKKKYGASLNEIHEHLQKLENELEELNKSAVSYEELEYEFKKKETEVNTLALKLTKSREKITGKFVNKINEELLKLGFKHVLFVVEHIECELSSYGKEYIQFLFTANPDEPPKPLLKVASGGELSRIMLAIKSTVCAGHSKDVARNVSPTMIFDEIDAGVSGEIAASVAKMLYKISRENQLLCITHQPIIAAIADNHFVVEKKTTDSFTQIALYEVKQEEKTDAIASLLSPNTKSKDSLTTDARQFAKSLLENARKTKESELTKVI